VKEYEGLIVCAEGNDILKAKMEMTLRPELQHGAQDESVHAILLSALAEESSSFHA
jgi:hypothetical protein